MTAVVVDWLNKFPKLEATDDNDTANGFTVGATLAANRPEKLATQRRNVQNTTER